MQSLETILSHARSLRIPGPGLEYIQKACESPSRIVGGSAYLSVSTRFASPKMGQVIQSESHTSELPFVHAQELDDDVLAYLDQPPSLFVQTTDKRGRCHRSQKTPDFLVIRKASVLLYECKTHSELCRLVNERSNDWVLDEGTYRYLPAESPAAAMGLTFRVHDAGTIGQIHAANLRLLVEVKRAGVACLEETQLNKAIRLLLRHNGMTMSNLAEEIHLDSVTPLIAAILQKKLQFLMKWQLLAKPETTTLFASEYQLCLAEKVLVAAAEDDVLRNENFQIPLALSPKAYERAVSRLDRLRRIRSGEIRARRSDFRHLRKIKECHNGSESPLLVVAPAYHLRGCRKCLPDEVEQVLVEYIDVYANKMRWSILAVCRLIRKKLREKGLSPVAYETVRQQVRRQSPASLKLSREGPRAANAAMPPVPISDRAIRSGYAWGRAHVDSTILDESIWLQCGISRILARPTFYLLVDEETNFLLAYWICFGSAGDQAVACLLRDCIRRHHLLPCSILHDQGSEYFSIYAESFTAADGCRPCAQA